MDEGAKDLAVKQRIFLLADEGFSDPRLAFRHDSSPRFLSTPANVSNLLVIKLGLPSFIFEDNELVPDLEYRKC